MKKQQLEFMIYPRFEEPKLWQLSGFIFGNWAVHKQHPKEAAELYWIISHVPSGVAGFECEKFVVACQAARRLAAMEQPPVVIINAGKANACVKPLPLKWVEKSANLLADMDILCRVGDALVHPSQLIEYIERSRDYA